MVRAREPLAVAGIERPLLAIGEVVVDPGVAQQRGGGRIVAGGDMGLGEAHLADAAERRMGGEPREHPRRGDGVAHGGLGPAAQGVAAGPVGVGLDERGDLLERRHGLRPREHHPGNHLDERRVAPPGGEAAGAFHLPLLGGGERGGVEPMVVGDGKGAPSLHAGRDGAGQQRPDCEGAQIHRRDTDPRFRHVRRIRARYFPAVGRRRQPRTVAGALPDRLVAGMFG